MEKEKQVAKVEVLYLDRDNNDVDPEAASKKIVKEYDAEGNIIRMFLSLNPSWMLTLTKSVGVFKFALKWFVNSIMKTIKLTSNQLKGQGHTTRIPLKGRFSPEPARKIEKDHKRFVKKPNKI